MQTRDLGTVIDPGKIYTFDPLLDEQRENAARERARARTFPERGPTAAEQDFVAALQQANDPRRAQAAQRQAEAELKRQRRALRVNDPVGRAAQIDIEDQEQRELRGQLRSLNRKIPRRGFGASLTDLISSIVPGSGALETQLEAGELATREATEINQAAQKRADLRAQLIGTRQQRIAAAQVARAAPIGQRAPQLARVAGLRETEQTLVRDIRNQSEVIRTSTARFRGFYEEATRSTTVLKSFGAAAIGSIGSIGVNAISFGIGAAIVAPVISAVAEGVNQGLAPAIERATGLPNSLRFRLR